MFRIRRHQKEQRQKPKKRKISPIENSQNTQSSRDTPVAGVGELQRFQKKMLTTQSIIHISDIRSPYSEMCLEGLGINEEVSFSWNK